MGKFAKNMTDRQPDNPATAKTTLTHNIAW